MNGSKKNSRFSFLRIRNPINIYKIRKKRKTDSKIAEVFGYSQGYMASSEDNLKKIKHLENEVEKMQTRNLDHSKLMHDTYHTKMKSMEDMWKDKCVICNKGIEAEKTRLISMQQDLLNSIQNFSDIYNKLIKYFSVMDVSYDTLLKNLGRIQSSKEYLESIKQEADNFVENSTKLLDK